MKLSRLREIIIEEIIEYSDIENIKKRKITNPQTKKPITVGSALTYDTSDPVYTKAKQIVQKGKDINPSPEKSNPHEKSAQTQSKDIKSYQAKSPKEYDSAKDIPGWREDIGGFWEEDEDNDNFVYDIDVNLWKSDHLKQGENSILAGVFHDYENGDSAGVNFNKKYVVPVVSKFARDAISKGRKVVHLQEKPGITPEQSFITKELQSKFGKNIKVDTWDGKATSIFESDSPVYNDLSKTLNLNEKKIKASIFYWAHTEEPDKMKDKFSEYIDLNDKETMDWLKSNGISDPKDISVDGESGADADAYSAFFENKDSDMYKIQLAYNAYREKNMLKKKNEYEKNGYSVISTPGSGHAYSLNKVWK